MKKFILGFLLIMVLAIGGGVYYVLTNLDALVEAAIEEHGSNAAKTAVRVSKVRIDLADGAGAVYGLTVANPKGFAGRHAFSLDQIRTKIDIKSLKEEPYIIDEITVHAPKVFAEINKDNKNNLNELKKNLPVGKATAKPSEDKAAAGPRLIIRRVLFSDGNIDAKVVPLNKEYQVKLPTLRMSNVGGKNGATADQIAKEILGRFTEQAVAEVKKQAFNAELEKLKGGVKEELKEKLKEELDINMEDKLKGLLPK